MDTKLIRNFAIVAHIDHGKSTLADRMLELCGTISKRDMEDQVLDSNPIEKERGITIKLAPVRMSYRHNSNQYILNLIDTPGHVDFHYEVSRSLSACEGIILVVDSTQGIQAQTVAHFNLVKKQNLKIIPVINKIDLPNSKADETKKALMHTFNFSSEEIILASAKMGTNVDLILKAVIENIPYPQGRSEDKLKALVFSSQYDKHKGIIVFTRIVDGAVRGRGQILKFCASQQTFTVHETGIFTPQMKPVESLSCGEVGYLATGLKDHSSLWVGDTLTGEKDTIVPLPGYSPPNPVVFLSIFPADQEEFLQLRMSLEKLHLTDSSFTFLPTFSKALGNGFLCGFLGLLHAEIIKERLEREYEVHVITTSPSPNYKVKMKDARVLDVKKPQDYPDAGMIDEVSEPVMLTTIYSPSTFIGQIMPVASEKRAEFINLEYIDNTAKFTYLIPLSEMMTNFYDKLKSATSGYASLEYEFYDYQKADLVKVDIYLNRAPVEIFSFIVHKEKAVSDAQIVVDKLKDNIPRHQFQIPVQAAIGGRIISRADIKAFRKDVTAKLYGGDRSRKDKLLKAQKKGKKKMKTIGKVNLPGDIFFKIYKN